MTDVHIDVKRLDDLVREISVRIPPERVNSEMERMFAEKRRTVTLKGFRKGKAPMEMIRSLYADQVKTEVVDTLIQATYPQAVRENTLHVASRPTVTDLQFTPEGGLTYTARVEVFPEIEKVEFEGLEIPDLPIEVSDEEVDRLLEQYRLRHATLRPVEREARPDDVVIADLTKVADPGLVLEAAEFPDSQIDLADPVTVRQFREAIPGMKAGEEKDIEVTYDKDYSDQRLAGATITYRCRIKAVKERLLPELSDAFAKTTGLGETLLELRLKLRQDIERHKQEELRRIQRRAVMGRLCERNPVPIPEGMLEEYLESVVKDVRERDPEVDIEEVRRRYRPVGEAAMRWNILWHALAEQEKVEVLPSDTEKWIETFARRYNMTAEQAREMLNQSGKLRDLRESMLEEKVIDLLLEKARPVPVPETDKDE